MPLYTIHALRPRYVQQISVSINQAMRKFRTLALAVSIPNFILSLGVGSSYSRTVRHSFVLSTHQKGRRMSMAAASEKKNCQGSDNELDLLHSWLHDGGARFPNIKIGRCPEEGGLGVYATHSISPGDVVLELPLSLCVVDWESTSSRPVPSSFEACGIGTNIPADVSKRLTWTTRMAAALIAEKSKNLESNFGPYLSVLSPEPPPNLPHRFVDTELVSKEAQSKWFEASVDTNFFRAYTLKDELDDAIQEISTENDSVPLPVVSPEQFSWAVDTIQSRAFRFELNDGGKLRVLAPLFDCFNHRSASQSYFELVQTDEFATLRLTVGDSYAIGDQVSISYGGKTSDDFCLYYGFFPGDDNLHAAAELHGGLSPPQLDQFRRDIDSIKITRGNEKLMAGLTTLLTELTKGPVSNAYMKLSLHPNDVEDLETLVSVAVAVGSATEAIYETQGKDYDADKAAASLLTERMQFELKQFPTTISQDTSTLAELTESQCDGLGPKTMMVQLRLQKKKVLSRFEALFSEVSVLDEPEQNQDLFDVLTERLRLM